MKKVLLLIPTILLLAGCNTTKNSVNSSNAESTSESESVSSEEEITGEVASFTFKTATGDSTWPNGGLGDGSHLTTIINKLNEEKTLFTEITQSKAQFNNNSEFKTMWIGAAESNGYVEFNTSVTVKKIEVEVQTYFKYDSYNKVMRFDGSTIFSVEDKDIDLSTEEVVDASEVKTQAFTFSQGLTKFKLSSTSGRTFLNKLTITYVE